MVGALWIHSLGQVGYMLEKIKTIWNCTTYRKKIMSRKKKKMVQNIKLLTKKLIMELKNANYNNCNVVINNLHPII